MKPQRDPSEVDPRFEAWLDGLLPPDQARELERAVERSPALRKRVERQRDIDAALRRKFSTAPTPRLVTSDSSTLPASSGLRPWAIAAGVLALLGGAAWVLTRPASTPASERPFVQGPRQMAPVASNCELDVVFASAVQNGFAPMKDVDEHDAWQSRLVASLGQPGCNDKEPTVVLGEYKDPRLALADMMMLRVGEEPVMLVVPRSDQAAGMCVQPYSGLHLHRGCWDGRTVYELSASPESRVLACVRADSVEPAARF